MFQFAICPSYICYPNGMINSVPVWKADYVITLFIRQLMHAKP